VAPDQGEHSADEPTYEDAIRAALSGHSEAELDQGVPPEPDTAGHAEDEHSDAEGSEQALPHPDEVEWDELSADEAVELAKKLAQTEDGLRALVEGQLRRAKFTKEMQELARQRELIEAREAALEALEAELEAQRAQAPSTAAPAAGPAPAVAPAAGQPPSARQQPEAWAQWFRTTYGREPNAIDLSNAVAAELEQRIGQLESQILDQQRQTLMQELIRQADELAEEYPDINEPEVYEKVFDYLRRTGWYQGPDTIKKAYMAVQGPKLLEKYRKGTETARKQQKQQRRSAATSLPQGPSTPTEKPQGEEPKTLDDVVNVQKRDPRIRQLLGLA